jgi:hypothetical protein
MRFRIGAAVAALIVAVLSTGGLVPGAAAPASAAPRAHASHLSAASAVSAASVASPSGCHTVFQPPNNWVVVCDHGSGSGGSGGGGSGGSGGGKVTCSFTPLTPAQIHFAGLPKPPKGEIWASIACPGRNPFGGVTLISRGTRVPVVTPQQLMEIAWNDLKIPVVRPATAPPRGAKGLVGLPEWFWVARGAPSGNCTGQVWQVVRCTVQAGPVWATVTATPYRLSFDPGGGLSGSSCPGPGTPYRRGGSTACSYTYNQSSAAQPGGKYAAAITVTWRVTWTGSGGVGGTLAAAHQVTTGFSLRVAEGQAVVTGTGR